ncbi:MAG: peptide ABC transporter substrate-binding protein [Alphaproteobacteria bacterium]
MLMRLLVSLLLVAAICVAPAGAKKRPRDELVIGITQFPSTFNPLIDSMLAKSYILAMTRRPMTVYDKDWKLVCLLCTELPTIENGRAVPEALPPGAATDRPGGSKGIALRVTIHPEAKWGDGTPVSTRDVVFTWKVGRNPKSGVGNMEAFRRVLRIDVKDEKTFILHVDRITFDYNDLAGFDLLPAHLEEKPFADPVEYRNRTTFDRDPANRGLYFGPYRITKVVSGSHVVLERNPTWYGKKPFFRRIVVRVIQNTAALEANLRSGGVDYIAGELGLTLDQAVAFEKRNLGKYNVIYKAGLIYEHLDLNLDNPILKDRRVRQALILGIDRDAISRQLFDGRQPTAHSLVSPLDWIAWPDVPKYRYDPRRADALLDAAGWRTRRGGIRHNDKGERLTLSLMTTAGNRSRELVEQVLQSQWRQIGIDVRIRNEPARVFFGQTVTRRKFTGAAMFAWISSPENVPRTTLHSSHIPTKANNYSGQNYTGFRNAEMDGLIDRIEVELDRTKRRALWRRLQKIYATELPVIPLYFRANAYIVPKWLKGIEPTGHQYPSTLWVENWSAQR